MRKTLAFLLVFLILILSACDSDKPETNAKKNNILVAMVGDVNGFGNDSYNNSALVGLERAKSDFDVDIQIYESNTVDDYMTNLTLAASTGANLVISRGFLMADATKIAAEKYPNTMFAILDYADIVADNIVSITFNEQEGSFLIGVIAALNSKTNTVGFIGGMQFPTDERYEFGFKAGVKAINPNIEVITNYTGSVSDDTLCKEAAIEQWEQGADVIYHATEQCKNGIIEAASEKGFWAIDVGNAQSSIDSDVVLCTMNKKFENVVYLTIQSLVKNELSMGNMVFGLTEDGVGYSDKAGNIDSLITDKAKAYADLIIKDRIEVPYDLASFEAF